MEAKSSIVSVCFHTKSVDFVCYRRERNPIYSYINIAISNIVLHRKCTAILSLEQRNAGIPRKTKTSQECSWERAEVASVVSPQEGSVYSSSSSSSSSSSNSSSSGVSASPAFLPGLSPNHLGSLLAGLFDHSSYFSFQMASRDSARMTSQPPSYSFFLSS